MPAEINSDLQVTYHGAELKDPHIVVARLAYRGRRDLPSAAFDQGNPMYLDVGTRIIGLLSTVLTPSRTPLPATRVSDSKIEIGPSLIRKRLEMEFVILVDGSNAKLDCYGPLADVKFSSQKLEETRRRQLSILRTIGSALVWVCLAFIIWWLIEAPTGAAHAIHIFFDSL
jgi:hypothetical protein